MDWDSVLGFLVGLGAVQAFAARPIQGINTTIHVAVSNSLFGVIGHRYDFELGVIGPMGESKVPANCSEEVMGFVMVRYGYERLCSFWRARNAAVEVRELETRGLKGMVDAILLELHPSFGPLEGEVPACMAHFVGELRPTSNACFESGDFQQKFKMIGARFLKADMPLFVSRGIKAGDDFLMIAQKSTKGNVDLVAKGLGFPNGRDLKLFLSGLLLVNSFDSVLSMTERNIIPAFEFRKRRRRRSQVETQE
jgi:hypothetical protein